MNTIILIDSCSDLPDSYVSMNELEVVNLSFTFKGNDYKDDFGCTLPYKEFYSEIRKGEMPTTAQVNVYEYEQAFRKMIDKGKDIVYICFSSALSGSYASAVIARQNILEEHPKSSIYVIDSRCASLGQGLLCHYIIEMAKSGASGKEIYEWTEQNKMKLNHFFTVNDLNHLKRGGRVSGAAAFVGTMLNIKPILTVDGEGRLKLIDKVKGRKKSLMALAKLFSENVEKPEGQTIAICHADCEDDVFYLEELIRNNYDIGNIIVNNIGPVIGSHTGADTVGLFFMGKERIE